MGRSFKRGTVTAALAGAMALGGDALGTLRAPFSPAAAGAYIEGPPAPFVQFTATPAEVRALAAETGLSLDEAAEKLLLDFAKEKFAGINDPEGLGKSTRPLGGGNFYVDDVIVFSGAGIARTAYSDVMKEKAPVIHVDCENLPGILDDPAMRWFRTMRGRVMIRPKSDRPQDDPPVIVSAAEALDPGRLHYLERHTDPERYRVVPGFPETLPPER